MLIGLVVIKKMLLKLELIIGLIMDDRIFKFLLIKFKCDLLGFWGVLVVIIIKLVFL